MSKDNTAQTAAVQVAVRIRPLTERDRAQPRFANSANGDVLRAHEKHVQVVPQNKYFTYDYVFGTETQQSDIFTALGQKPVYKFIEGYNVTILAYGQTSSGKTYTMGTAQHDQQINPKEEGIIPRAMSLLFDSLLQKSMDQPVNGVRSLRVPAQTSGQKYRYSVKVSFVEIYNEELIDLLNPAPPHEKPPVTIREDTKGHIYWTGVKEVSVNNTDDVLYYLQQGTQNRATGFTDMNEKSSRSHAIFSVTLKQEKWVPGNSQSGRASPTPSRAQSPKQQRLSMISRYSSSNSNNNNAEDGDWVITSSKFHFVDLAGSERLKRTAAEGDRRKEGININAGLLALGNVISALGDPSKKGTHVPYRDSKLTRLLQDSLGGNAMTLMIACVSPAESNLAETLNTLQYANRARNIKNKMEKNELEEWMTTDNIDFLRNTIAKLKNELRKSNSTQTTHTIPTKMQIPSDNRFLSDFSDDYSSTSSPLANGDYDDFCHEQNLQIADLQYQIEDLKAKAEIMSQRNVVVEEELARLKQSKNGDIDFQKAVEPVIEEYEKTLSGYESQLAMIRAALNHAEHAYEEQLDKVQQSELIIEKQDKTIAELRKRLSKLLERQQKDEKYIAELEKKLMTTVQESVQDRELMMELRGKILKLKEVDENTENYIRDLETRLNASEEERSQLKARLEELQKNAKEESLIANANESLSLHKSESLDEKDKELKSLREKYETAERQKLELQAKLDQLLSESTMESKGPPEDERRQIRKLEMELANLQHDHQETLKEFDELLLRYQEALDHADALQSVHGDNVDLKHSPTENKEILVLRDKVKYLERELALKSRQDNNEASTEAEPTSNKQETSGLLQQDESIVQNFSELQRRFEHLKMEAQLHSINIANQQTIEADIFNQDITMEELYEKYELQMASYRQEIKNAARLLKEVKKIKTREMRSSMQQFSANDDAYTNNGIPSISFEHRVLLRNITNLEKQMSEQNEKLKTEAKKFSSEIMEIILKKDSTSNEHSNIPTSSTSLSSSSPSAEDTVLSEEDIPEKQTNQILVLKQHEEARSALQTRLFIAKQDLMCHKSIISVLENKLRNVEITVALFKKRTENNVLSVDDVEMEELMLKMDAMKLQLEGSEKMESKSISDV
ncbi:kinesin-domain-containing protein [Rhizopus microsporus]|uniref:Kinesin-domain-containing protein n=1 Tax=Rhizopus microsporus TaxID=58291 RepID=A0A1X0RYF2_RHIZD|nr:kinesin-domain-containing protein [Rhizopus microsporus]